jgi:hypothetical protein
MSKMPILCAEQQLQQQLIMMIVGGERINLVNGGGKTEMANDSIASVCDKDQASLVYEGLCVSFVYFYLLFCDDRHTDKHECNSTGRYISIRTDIPSFRRYTNCTNIEYTKHTATT